MKTNCDLRVATLLYFYMGFINNYEYYKGEYRGLDLSPLCLSIPPLGRWKCCLSTFLDDCELVFSQKPTTRQLHKSHFYKMLILLLNY